MLRLLLAEALFICVANSRSDSILDIINTKEVEKIIAERQRAEHQGGAGSDDALYTNALDESTAAINAYAAPTEYDIAHERERVKLLDDASNIHAHAFATQQPTVRYAHHAHHQNATPYRRIDLFSAHGGHKLLKSSKNALAVTKMEYLRRDWCNTEPLIQKIKEDGCLTRTIINRFCYGQCNSFYIPKNPKSGRKRGGKGSKHGGKYRGNNLDEDDDDEMADGPAFKSCAFCKPKNFTWITVTLTCPNRKPPQFRRRRIQRIKQCKCIATDLH